MLFIGKPYRKINLISFECNTSSISIRNVLYFNICFIIKYALFQHLFRQKCALFQHPFQYKICTISTSISLEMCSTSTYNMSSVFISIYDSFHWKCYTPKIHQIQKLELLRNTNSHSSPLSVSFCTADTETSEFLDVVTLGGVAFSVENCHNISCSSPSLFRYHKSNESSKCHKLIESSV